jgi:glycosyltransferase involved in cell wall biosynthesis
LTSIRSSAEIRLVRILYFHQYFATRESTVATRSYEIARRLVKRGHQVTVISRDMRENTGARRLVSRDTVDGILIVYVRVPYSQYYRPAKRIASFLGFMVAACVLGLLQPRPDVVLATSTPLTIGVPGLLTARLKRAPFVFEIRDLWPAVPISLGILRNPLLVWLSRWLEATLYRGAARVVVLSEGAREALLEQGVPADKLVFAPNASDLDLFSPNNVDEHFREQYGLTGKFLALYAGAMGRANGIEQLADAAAALRAAGNDRVAVVVIGDGPQRPGLERRRAAENLDNLLVLPPVAKHELAGVVGAADVTLTLFAAHPALQANSPNKLFDSLAAGRPVVLNLDGWLRRVVTEAGAGVYVPAGDGEALAATLAALAAEPEVVAAMGLRARALAEREFSRDTIVDRLADALEAVAGGHHAA